MKEIYIFLFMLIFSVFCYGQSSFFKILDYNTAFPGASLVPSPILTINTSGDISFAFSDTEGVFKMVKLSNEGEVLYGVQIEDNVSIGFWRPFTSHSKGNWDIVLASLHGGGGGVNAQSALFMININDNILWSKKIAPNQRIRQGVLITENNHLFCTSHPFDEGTTPLKAGITRLDLETGNQQWGYFYKKSDPLNRRTIFKDIKETPNGRLSVLAERDVVGVSNNDDSLILIDTSGNLLKNIALTTDSIVFSSQAIDAQSNIYLLGRKLGKEGDIVNNTDGIIVKLDVDYNVLWAKKLVAEQFDFYQLEVEILPNGDLIFAYATYGRLPVITGKISSDGELLWHKGYAFAFPQLGVGQDGSIYLTSSLLFSEDGTYERRNILAKTTLEGEIEGCPQFDACLRLEDMEITLEEEAWERIDAPFLADVDVTMAPLTFTVRDTCGVPAYPQADFSLPDTICQYSCLSPDSLKNSLANYVEWTIVGPGTDTLMAVERFEWCFDSAGVYTVEQEVWLLGCSEFFSKRIEVLSDDLDLSLGGNQYICRDIPYVLSPTAARPLQGFLWNDGSETAGVSVLQPGDYSLTATDGFCRDSAVINLSLIDDLLAEEPLDMPLDTTLCPDLLPYSLRPLSPYSTHFYLNNKEETDSIFRLTEEGIYTVNIDIENCVFSKNFELLLEECAAPIYIANVFSPNDDGINDNIFPQGQDFYGIQLQVFNRWGDLIFETHQPPFSWNGDFNDRELDVGTYLLVFTYFNQRNAREEVLSKDVLLLR